MEDNEKSLDIVVGPSNPLISEGEVSSVKARQKKVTDTLLTLGITVSENSSPPVIAILGSGGGLRAMIAFLGTLTKLAEVKLLDAATYVCGVSGSTWCLSTLCNEKKWSDQAFLEYMENTLCNRLKASWDWKRGWRKVKDTFMAEIYSLTNPWAYLVVNGMTKQLNEEKLSNQKDGCETGDNPYPIYSAVEKGSLGKNDPGAWFEFTPHLSGFPAYGCFVKTELLGSKFEAGKLTSKNAENDLCYFEGMWGSALASYKIIQENIKNLIHHLVHEGKGLDEGGDAVDAEQEPPCTCKGCDKLRELFEEPPPDASEEQTEKFWQGLVAKLEDHIKGLLEEAETIASVLPSGICRGFEVLKQTLDCLTQWKWGTTNNFLYNWNSNIQSVLPGKQHISLVDAGLEINSGFPLVLPPHRKVDLILSFDFSEGDPFLTVKTTSEYCEKNGVPFPKINIDENDQNIPLKSCYIFNGDGNGTPDVMHFPLFNNQTSEGKVEEMRRKYATAHTTYDEDLFKALLDVSKNNVAVSMVDMQKKIRECVQRCNQEQPMVTNGHA